MRQRYKPQPRADRLKVTCIEGPEKGRTWISVRSAQIALGFASATPIVNSTLVGYLARGRQFRLMYPDGRIIAPDRLAKRRRPIVPLWVGSTWYPSIHAAAVATGAWDTELCRQLHRRDGALGRVRIDGEWVPVRAAKADERPEAA